MLNKNNNIIFNMMVITMTAFSSRKILLTSFLGVTFSLFASDAFAAAAEREATEEDLKAFIGTQWQKNDPLLLDEKVRKEKMTWLSAGSTGEETSDYYFAISLIAESCVAADTASSDAVEFRDKILSIRTKSFPFSRKALEKYGASWKASVLLDGLTMAQEKYFGRIKQIEDNVKKEQNVAWLESVFKEISEFPVAEFTPEQNKRIQGVREALQKRELAQIAAESAAAGKP